MLYRTFIPIKEYKAPTEKTSIIFFTKIDVELKSDNITDENEGKIEDDNDFFNCNIIFARNNQLFCFVVVPIRA